MSRRARNGGNFEKNGEKAGACKCGTRGIITHGRNNAAERRF